MAVVVDTKSIGFSNPLPSSQVQPPTGTPDLRDTIAHILDKHQQLETLVNTKVSKDGVKSAIKYSDEIISIQAQDIVLVGNVTIAQIIKEQNGTSASSLPASITRIIGNRIQTGSIQSNNWGASEGTAIDLDNNRIWMGGSDAPALYYDGAGNLAIKGTLTAGAVIAGTVTISGTSPEVVVNDLVTGVQAAEALQQQLEVSGTTVLKGVIQPTDSGAIKVGSITWNATTGALTGGTGVAITEWGIIGANSGTPTFSIQASTGAAIFAGSLSAATGTFAGSLSAASGTFTGSLSAASGTFAGTISTSGSVYATGSVGGGGFLSAAVVGSPSSGGVYGVVGNTSGATAVVGYNSSGLGGYFGSGGAGYALEVFSGGTGAIDISNGGIGISLGVSKITKTRQNGQQLKVYDTSTHSLIATYEYSFN